MLQFNISNEHEIELIINHSGLTLTEFKIEVYDQRQIGHITVAIWQVFSGSKSTREAI